MFFLILKALRINWQRFQGLASVSAGLISDPLYLEIVPIMTEILELSSIVDSYDSQMKSFSSLRELFYFLPQIKEHAFLVLEGQDSDVIRHLECLGTILQVFTLNASSSWPEEVKI